MTLTDYQTIRKLQPEGISSKRGKHSVKGGFQEIPSLDKEGSGWLFYILSKPLQPPLEKRGGFRTRN
ncbi:MAG TPA: hypothetical protein VK435_06200 [Thermodesulfovibrionales bacterium]|nr:hypothetical protein [Thermodesulfovibrionales bacterium]